MKISSLFVLGVAFTVILCLSLMVLADGGMWLFLGITVVSSFILGMLANTAIMEDALDPDNYPVMEE